MGVVPRNSPCRQRQLPIREAWRCNERTVLTPNCSEPSGGGARRRPCCQENIPPVRLLFLSERFPPEIGGVAASARRHASALANLGHEVHVLAFTRELPGAAAASQ